MMPTDYCDKCGYTMGKCACKPEAPTWETVRTQDEPAKPEAPITANGTPVSGGSGTTSAPTYAIIDGERVYTKPAKAQAPGAREFLFYKNEPVDGSVNGRMCCEVDPAKWDDPKWTEDYRTLRLIEYAAYENVSAENHSLRKDYEALERELAHTKECLKECEKTALNDLRNVKEARTEITRLRVESAAHASIANRNASELIQARAELATFHKEHAEDWKRVQDADLIKMHDKLSAAEARIKELESKLKAVK